MKLSRKCRIKKLEDEPSSSREVDSDLSVQKVKKGKLNKSSNSSDARSNAQTTSTGTSSATGTKESTTTNTGGSEKVHPSSSTDLTPRERQYLFSAGLHPMQVKKKREQSKLPSSAGTSASTNNSAEEFATRALGSTCPKTRHDAIQRLQLYLSTSAATKGISYLDIKKLWKGMWYGLYMCDKVVVQDELSSHMAQLIWSVAGTIEGDIEEAQNYVYLEEQALEDDKDDSDDEDDVPIEDAWDHQLGELQHQDPSDEDEVVTLSSNEEESEVQHGSEEDPDNENYHQHTSVHLVCLFLKGYFETIHREWGRMDKHRIDKFYRSMRLMLSHVFQYLATREWHIGIIHMLNDVVFNEILCCDEDSIMLKYPNGVRFHLIDILLDELVKVSNGTTGDDNNNKNNNSDVPINTIEFLALLEPYLTIAMADSDKVVQARVMDNILHKFISQYSVLSTTHNDSDTTPLLLHNVNVHSVAEQIFDVASNVDTADRYRSSLYQMHKLYMRKIKEAKAISDGTTHCEEVRHKETEQSKNEDHYVGEETEEEEEEKEESTSESKRHKKHKKKQKKRKSSASDLCEVQCTEINLAGKKIKVQTGGGDKGASATGAQMIPLMQEFDAVNTSPAAENMLEDVTHTKVGIDSDTKRSKKRKNDATGKDKSELKDYVKPQKNQPLDNIILKTSIADDSQLKRVETHDIVHSKKSKLQLMDEMKQKTDDKNLKKVGMHNEGMVSSKKMSIDNMYQKKDGKDVESAGVKQAGAVDNLPAKDKPYLTTKKKHTKDDKHLEKLEVKQGRTVNVVSSNTGKDTTTKLLEGKPDTVQLKNTLQSMEEKNKKDDAGKKRLTRDDTVNSEPFKKKALSADDKHCSNKVGEKQGEDINAVKTKSKTQSMDHKKPKKGDTTNINNVDSASLEKNPPLMDDKKPVDNLTGSAVDKRETNMEIVVSDSLATKKKKKKKNKKNQNQQGNLDFTAASKELDDEIVISLREQSDYLIDAVKSINASQSQKSKTSTISVPPLTKKQQTAIDDAAEKERQRRVKFGCTNRSKSYKASMTALQTMQHPATATREPEKPILREPKYASSPVPSKDRSKNRYSSAK